MKHDFWTRFFAAVAVFLTVVALFALGIAPTHLRLDDWGYVTGCSFVKDGFSWANLGHAFSDFGHGGIWMPLTYLSYMLDVSWWGGGWRVHHVVNVILHGVNALLVLGLVWAAAGRRGGGMTFAALAAALIWALHPMRAEAVVWVASRKEELWTLFGLTGIIFWIGFCLKGGFLRWLAVFVLFTAACLSKPTAVCLPVLALVVWVWLRAGDVSSGDCGGMKLSRCLLLQLPMFALAFATGLMAMYSQTHPTDMARVVIADTTFGWRLLNAAVSLGLYARHTFVPVGLHIDYRAVPGEFPLDGVLGLTVLGMIVGVAGVLLSRRFRNTAVGTLVLLALVWAFVTVLPVLGLLGLTGDKAYADRYAYMPTIGLSLVLAGLLVSAPRWVRGAVVLAIGIEAVLAVPAIIGYRTDRLAYERALAADPDHWRALRMLGSDCCALQGRMDDGIAMLRRSLSLHSSKLTADSLAYALACRGTASDVDEVMRLGRIVAENPRRDPGGLMLDALGMAAFKKDDPTNAVRFLSAALVAPARSHGNVHAMLNLGLALERCGRSAEAVRVLERLRGTANADVRREAGDALARLQRIR